MAVAHKITVLREEDFTPAANELPPRVIVMLEGDPRWDILKGWLDAEDADREATRQLVARGPQSDSSPLDM